MAKMNLKVDWKQLLIEKGELVALIAAGVLCVLMLLPMMWFALFGQSSKSVADDLAGKAKELSDKQARATPTDADNPPKLEPGKEQVVLVKAEIKEPEKFGLTQWFTPTVVVDTSRRQRPNVLSPTEGAVGVAVVQTSSYILIKDGQTEKIKLLQKGSSGGTGPTANKGGASDRGPQMPSIYGGAGMRRPGMGMGGMPGRGGYYQGPQMQGQGLTGEARSEATGFTYAATEGWVEDPAQPPAQQVKPLRMAIICANFPLREQILEFKKKLNWQSPAEWQTDVSGEIDPKTEQPELAFRFLGVDLERRVVDADGNPVVDADGKTSTWQPINVFDVYRDLVYFNGQRYQPEAKGVDSVMVDGLSMQRLVLMRNEQSYPTVEAQLATVQTSISNLEKVGAPPPVKPVNPLRADNFDPFKKRPPATFTTTGAGGAGLPPKASPMPTTAKLSAGREAPGFPTNVDPNDVNAYPEYALLRVIDPTIEGGKFYQYRVQVRMGNPNYGRPDVASPSYASSKEPLLSDWFEIKLPRDKIPQIAAVPKEYHLYVLDQKELDDNDRFKGYPIQNGSYTIRESPPRQTYFQIHKWLEYLGPVQSPLAYIGEWSVAERVPVYRGEIVALNKQRVEVPFWKETAETFVLAQEAGGAKTRNAPRGVEVDFRPPLGDAILVDFEGGDTQQYTRVSKTGGDKPETATVKEKAGVDALIFSPEGKLLSHNSWTDKADQGRETRVFQWRFRINEVRSGRGGNGPSTTVGGSGGGNDPNNDQYFGPSKPRKP